jgi:D-aminopeptidase
MILMMKGSPAAMLLGLMAVGAIPLQAQGEQRPRLRDLAVTVGLLPVGPGNAITDVSGVRVGHRTRIEGEGIRTGVTAIVPHGGNLFQEKVPAAVYVGNGFGKLAGSTQVEELGNIESPIVLTNTLAVGTALRAVVQYTLKQPGNEQVVSVNAIVGETNDSWLSDIRSMPIQESDVLASIDDAVTGPVAEGAVGAGTGTVAFSYKAGIGTSSRVFRIGAERYTLGVLVQANYGAFLEIKGVPLYSKEAENYLKAMTAGNRDELPAGNGSCMIVVATDAPLDARNLKRVAKRTVLALGKTGSAMSNGSGDYAIAFSTAYRIPYQGDAAEKLPPLIANDSMSLIFQAAVEATEEAVYNSLLKAETMRGFQGHTSEALSVDRVRRALGGLRR